MTSTIKNSLGFTVLNNQYTQKVMKPGIKSKEIDPWDLAMVEEELNRFGFTKDKRTTGNEFTQDFPVPGLLGDDIRSHFELMAQDLCGKYFRTINKIVRRVDLDDLPDVPSNLSDIVESNKWVKITKSDIAVLLVPDSEWLVLDFETFVQGSKHDSPIIGTALGQDPLTDELAYYIWCHPSLCDNDYPYRPMLASIGSDKVVIMHNASFDAALIEERYTLNTFENFYLCTLSMNRVVAGLSDDQSWAINFKGTGKPKFLEYGCSSSLVKAYEFHTGKKLPSDAKDPRNLFVEATDISQIRDSLEVCLQYALKDVILTLELFLILYPKYSRDHLQSKVPIVGASMLINSVVPVRPDWHEWLANVEATWQSHQEEMKSLLNQLADRYHQQWVDEESDPEQDPWLRNLDWTQSKYFVDRRVASWYEEKAIFDIQLDVSAKADISHYLLKLKWNGIPLQKTKDKGWCFGNTKVPHKSGDDDNVGSVLTSHYAQYFDEGVLTSEDDVIGKRLCYLIGQCSFWTSMRTRMMSIYTHSVENPVDGTRMLLVAPRVSPHQTSTGRITDPVFVVLAAHTEPKVGAEIKACCYSYPPYRFVGGDIDSQEAVILRILGESEYGVNGSTPFGAALMVGDKKVKTDIHSLAAASAGVSRDAGKQAVYSVSFGAGIKAVAKAFIKWHPDLSLAEAKVKAKSLLATLKGKRSGDMVYGGMASLAFNSMRKIMGVEKPRIPMLGTSPSKALYAQNNGRGVTPSLLNCAIQGAASSYGFLSCLLVANAWLAKNQGVWSRFSASIHDK